MKFPDLKLLIEEHLALVPDGNCEMHIAEEIAPKFQLIRGKIAEMRMLHAVQRNKQYSMQKTTLKAVTLTLIGEKKEGQRGGLTADDRKRVAEADPEYLTALETAENLDARIAYLSVMLDVFANLHVFYRQIAKGGDL